MKDFSDYSLLAHNTFGIDAKCRRFVEYDSEAELLQLLPELSRSEEAPLLHIGGGSNLLFTRDFPGTILHSAIKGVEIVGEDAGGVLLRAGAGEDWDMFVARTIAMGCYGLENLSLIPGEVGACAVQNIGAYGVEVGQLIERVETVEIATGERRELKGEACEYAYRSSIFKHAARGKYVVTHVVFRLSRRFVPQVGYAALAREMEKRGMDAAAVTAEDVRALVCDIRRGKLPEPKEVGSAGSFFMNPVVPAVKCEALLETYPNMPHYEVEGGVKVPAGWLIEQAGWKGKRVGHVGVWPLQALVLVNHGDATGDEIVRLSDAIRADVRSLFGIDLHPEVNFI